MPSILIESANAEHLALIAEYARRMGEKVSSLSDSAAENMKLGTLMSQSAASGPGDLSAVKSFLGLDK